MFYDIFIMQFVHATNFTHNSFLFCASYFVTVFYFIIHNILSKSYFLLLLVFFFKFSAAKTKTILQFTNQILLVK